MKETCEFQMNGNIKLGERVGTFSKAYGDGVYFNTTLKKFVKGSCGGFCEGCYKACYVRKSYRYPSVVERHTMNTYLMRENLHACFEHMRERLAHMRNKPILFRINQSGEIETFEEFVEWCETAKANPNTTFYVYSKNYDVITKGLEGGHAPNNLIVLVSIWHEYGIETYRRLAHFENVKAFVYVDGFNYEAYGIIIQTMCMAYDENGKMNHAVTCFVCGKCFRSKLVKVIGCFDHS